MYHRSLVSSIATRPLLAGLRLTGLGLAGLGLAGLGLAGLGLAGVGPDGYVIAICSMKGFSNRAKAA